MSHSNDYGDRAELSFDIAFLSDAEKDLLKTLHPQTIEYRAILDTAYRAGLDVLKVASFYTKAHNRADDDRKGQLTSNQNRAVKLAAIIRHLVSSSRIERDVVLFDCWAAFGLAGYKMHSGTGLLVKDGKYSELADLYHESYNLYRAAFGVGTANLDSFSSMVLGKLKDRKYSPWLDTIESISPIDEACFQARHGFDPQNMAKFLFGDDTELTQALFRYHMTGAIKRTFEPGCQHDSMLILISPEKGLGKTSFLKAIARTPDEPKHSTSQYLQMRSLKSSKADLEKLAGKVIVNLDECDSAFYGLNADDLKEVITATVDNYRQPYAKTARDYARQMVPFGTSNKTDLIQDMNGDRRFFPVLVSKFIDTAWVTENWESFWGYYKYCYLQGQTDTHYRNYVNKAEEALLLKLQVGYKAVQPWMETAIELVNIMEVVSKGSLMFSPTDLLAVLVKETGTTKQHHKEAVTALLTSDRGYLIGRPKDSNGKQAGKARPYKGTTPRSFSRADITNVYRQYLEGTLEATSVVELPQLTKVVEYPDSGFSSLAGTQLNIWNLLERAEIKAKKTTEPSR